MTHCPHCGVEIEAKPKKRRSVPQHRRYFALIRSAYDNWPERHEFHPANEEHLRKWLQARAGHRIVDTIDADNMTPVQSVATIAAAMKRAGPYAFVSSEGSRLYVIVSDTVAFDDLPHLQACALFDAVAEIIEAETGIRVDDMIKVAARPRKEERAHA